MTPSQIKEVKLAIIRRMKATANCLEMAAGNDNQYGENKSIEMLNWILSDLLKLSTGEDHDRLWEQYRNLKPNDINGNNKN